MEIIVSGGRHYIRAFEYGARRRGRAAEFHKIFPFFYQLCSLS